MPVRQTLQAKKKVAGPFTVESLSPTTSGGRRERRTIDGVGEAQGGYSEERGFVQMILENIKAAGVQQATGTQDRLQLTHALAPGDLICAGGRFLEGSLDTGTEKRTAVFISPEFGTVSRPDLVAAAREAGDANFEALIIGAKVQGGPPAADSSRTVGRLAFLK